jgi:hypothetical protein
MWLAYLVEWFSRLDRFGQGAMMPSAHESGLQFGGFRHWSASSIAIQGAVAMFASFVLLSGCGPSGPPKPITNEILDLRSQSAMHFATVHFPEDSHAESIEVSGETMSRLIAALGPIRRNSNKPVLGDSYELHYQAGMNPTTVYVRMIDEEQLKFTWDNFSYVGGNPKAFKATIESVLETQPQ